MAQVERVINTIDGDATLTQCFDCDTNRTFCAVYLDEEFIGEINCTIDADEEKILELIYEII